MYIQLFTLYICELYAVYSCISMKLAQKAKKFRIFPIFYAKRERKGVRKKEILFL